MLVLTRCMRRACYENVKLSWTCLPSEELRSNPFTFPIYGCPIRDVSREHHTIGLGWSTRFDKSELIWPSGDNFSEGHWLSSHGTWRGRNPFFIFSEMEQIIVLSVAVLHYKIAVLDEPQFRLETAQERKGRTRFAEAQTTFLICLGISAALVIA